MNEKRGPTRRSRRIPLREDMNIHTLYDKFSSVRLTIFLCILLAFVSVVGTVIPQNMAPEKYQTLYRPAVAEVVTGLGLDDLYHSAGFIFLLCLLAVNLAACTAKRLPGTWRSLRRGPSPPSEAALEKWKCRETFLCAAGAEEVEGRLESIVAKALGRRPTGKHAEGPRKVLLVEKNRYARLGPYLAHASILLILLGTLWGAVIGFKAGLQLTEGEAASDVWLQKRAERVPLGFQIRCDRFVFNQYPDGTPKEYRSDVTFLDMGGKEILRGSIRVNHPLTCRGITFYQATYGSIPKVTLQLIDEESGSEASVTTGLNTPFQLPGSTGERAMVTAFQENVRIPAEMARVTSFSMKSLGPAARVVIFDEKGFHDPFLIFRDHPAMGQERAGTHRIVLKGFRLTPYTGLQVVKDPGTPLVWIGCTFLVIGFLMALLMDHEIVWVVGEAAGEKAYRIRMVGRAVRHPGIYAARFDRQKLRLRKGLSPWLKS